jgi:hypothetical protein
MSFIRQLIEKKISTATGATVMFGDFKFSPMSGKVEALQVKVAAERFVPPFLSIERLEMQVAVARALRGEIAVKSLTIDRPVLIVAIHSDGGNNLARKPASAEAIVRKEGAAGGSWEFNCDKIELLHGRLDFRDATRDNYKLSVEGINATVTPEGADLAVTVTADSIGRRDQPVELGVLKLLAKLAGGGLRDPLASSLSARASIADSIVIQIMSSLIANRSFDVEIAGKILLKTLVSFLPLSPAQTWALNGDGTINLRSKLTLDLLKSIRVSNLEFSAGGFSVDRTFGHHSGDGRGNKPASPVSPVTKVE